MAHYINKDDLEEKIKSYKDSLCDRNGYLEDLETNGRAYYILNELEDFIDTLEVKEMDIEESARYYLLNEHKSPLNEVFHQADLNAEMQYHKDIENAFKAGFKLGLKVKGE